MTLDNPLGRPWPDEVWVARDGSMFGGYLEDGMSALACFEDEDNAEDYVEWCREEGWGENLQPCRVTFDYARSVAKARKLTEYPVTCMVLLDDPDNPEIHYVQ